MKILLASAAFHPEKSPRSLRATELALELAKQGHDITVVTLDRGVESSTFCNFHNLRCISIKRFLTPIRIPSSGFGNYLWRGINRILLLTLEYPDIELLFRYYKALSKLSGYDLIISFAVPYPVHWGVAYAKKYNPYLATSWIADCGDPYIGLENDTFKRFFYFRYLESKFCEIADFITIPIEEARRAYLPRFSKKIFVIPQGLSFPEMKFKKPINQKVTFVYAGNLSSYIHYLRPFLEELNKVNIDFRFRVFTSSPSIIWSMVNPSMLSKLEVLPYVDRLDLLQELHNADFLVHFPYLKPSQRSMKLIDYEFSQRPVLSYSATEQDNRILNEYLQGKFGAINSPNIDKYRIETVARSFIELVAPKMQKVLSS